MPLNNTLVEGKNVIIYLLYDGQYYPVFCAKSAVLEQSQEEIEVTSVNSGNDREFEPGMTTSSLQISGITTLNNSYSRISVLFLMQLAVRRSIQTMKVYLSDGNSVTREIGFNAIITQNSITKDLGGAFSQSSTSFRVTGGVTISPQVDPPGVGAIQDPLYLDGTPGAKSVHDDLLEQNGVEILHVERSGIGHSQVVGTPGSLEFRFDGPNGDIHFDPNNPFNPGPEVIYILYQLNP